MIKFIYNKDYYINNIKEVLEAVPLSYYDRQYWFNDMRKWCEDLSVKIGIPVTPVVGTFAALSPQCSVKFNKIFAEAYYAGFEKHTKANIDKCNRINAMYGYLNMEEEVQVKQIMSYLKGRKTSAFFHNILNPDSSELVTIDRWMLKIAGLECPSITDKQYDFLSECYCSVANENYLLPLRLQSILWTYYRESQGKHLFYD